MGRCLGDRRSLRQNFKLSPVRRTATGRRRCFVVRIGAGAGGSRVDAMRDANVHGICSLKRGPTRTDANIRRSAAVGVITFEPW